uniref:Uncharacterized protein n=1 Tax=Nicotiana tabacum TaxID=4097 RepID=A0A1S4ATF4_TOBAC|nr:PREDICTED: uncharacterized protein LOC107801039 [Nicotiana tabacum]
MHEPPPLFIFFKNQNQDSLYFSLNNTHTQTHSAANEKQEENLKFQKFGKLKIIKEISKKKEEEKSENSEFRKAVLIVAALSPQFLVARVVFRIRGLKLCAVGSAYARLQATNFEHVFDLLVFKIWFQLIAVYKQTLLWFFWSFPTSPSNS